MNKNNIIITFVLVVLLVGALLFVIQQNKTTVTPTRTIIENGNDVAGPTSTTSRNEIIELAPFPSNVPSGWKTYQNQHLSVAFAYPPTWTLQEHIREDGSRTSVKVLGDGYQVTVFELTHGIEQEGVTYTTPEYFVAGQRARAWYAEIGQGFRLVIGLPNCKYPRPTFSIENSSSTSKQIIDQLLTTVVCN